MKNTEIKKILEKKDLLSFEIGALLTTKEDRIKIGKGNKCTLNEIFDLLLDEVHIPICVISNKKNETFKEVDSKNVVKDLEIITFYIRYKNNYEA